MIQGITQVQRQVIGWFEVADKAAFSTETFPVFIFDDCQLGEYYGFPEFDNLPGMKIGKFYHLNEAALPDELCRDITSADEKVSCSAGSHAHAHSYGEVMLKGLHQLALQCSPPVLQCRPQVLRDGVSRYLPGANGRMLKAVACMFTNSPDSRFIIDKHPLHHQVTYSECRTSAFAM